MSLTVLITIVLGFLLVAGTVLLAFSRWFESKSAMPWWLQPDSIFSALVLAATVFAFLTPHS